MYIYRKVTIKKDAIERKRVEAIVKSNEKKKDIVE